MSIVRAAIQFQRNPSAKLQRALLKAVYNALRRDILRLAKRFHYVVDESALDDVMQAVWTQLFLKVIRLAAGGSISRSEQSACAYLRKIMRNDMLDILREHARVRPLLADDRTIEALADPVGDGGDQEADRQARRDQDEVIAAMKKLSADDQAIIRLKLFQSFSHRQIGTQLGISEALSRVRYHRAIRRLRDELI
jgi:RNA polymerase sigma factor (sigma-70 family)